MPSRKRAKPTVPPHVFQRLVVLAGTDPLVWRSIQVPETYSFWDLHVAIQDAMGWKDCHLDELRGHVAATANHCTDRRLRRELDALFARLTTEMDRYDDGQ
jgi:hypothetical protein